MDLLSIFKRKTPRAAGAAPVGGVQLARTRARRRLTGAAVLVVIGIVGFPLLFETQPRPIRVDVPIDIPEADNVAPLVMPAPQPPASVTMPSASSARAVGTSATAQQPVTDSSNSDRVRSLRKSRSVGASTPKPAAGGSRFVVQVGAFADTTAARKARLKLEALGLKTYIQVARTRSGKLIRVRAGPYPKREQADKVAAKVRGAAIPAVVLTL